ncbi:MAG TPA: hypothetical protein VFM18_21940 [Methanosarcina sp.]|nr:hypothetical protein [Methanosarcina sp.]
MKKNEFKGYSLFNDIEDVALRNRNRAVVMANMVEQNTKQRKMTPKGAQLVIGYFGQVPDADKEEVNNLFDGFIKERGYASK